MRLRILSDLHCEGYTHIYEYAGEDVLILAGDIHTRNRHEELISQVPEKVKIVLVAGNHEYYRGIYEDVNEYLFGLETKYPNFKYLHNNATAIDGVEFFGGTMYTDFGLYGEDLKYEAELMAGRGINDFYVSRKFTGEADGATRMWSTRDHTEQHHKFCYELEGWLKSTEGKKRVVVSHFVPTPQAIHPRWGQNMLNPYFTANMERFMGWEGMWFAGHTHDSADVMVGDTRVVINPKGYGVENKEGFSDHLIFEI